MDGEAPGGVGLDLFGDIEPDFADQIVHGAEAIDEERACGPLLDLRQFTVELVLNGSEDFFEDVFERDHAGDGAELVDNHGDMGPLLLEFLEGVAQPHRFGEEFDFAGEAPERLDFVTLHLGEEDVLGVDHSDHTIELAIADGEAGVARVGDQIEIGVERFPRVEEDDVPAGHHDLADHLVFEVEDILHDEAFAPAQFAALG